MNCPYCQTFIAGMTGLQEALKFQAHLKRCGQSPAHQLAKRLAGTRWKVRHYDLNDALTIRAASGQ